MDYASLPKIELHLHLDCSLSYQVVHRLDPEVDENKYRQNFIAPPKCLDLADFLSRTSSGIQLMQKREQLSAITKDLLWQLKADGVIYAEIRFAPILHTEGGLSPAEVVETVLEALEEGIQKTKVEARLLLCTLRHYTETQSMETIHLVKAFRGSKVVGFDIASDEANFPIDAHRKAFQYARQHNIPRTAHAGEARGAESVWETLEHFAPSRIGHGVRSVEDPELINHLIKNNIHLEVCPTSNIQTNVFDRYSDHPIDALYKAGISLGINTDGRTIANVSLSEEYEKVEKNFGWEKKDFLQCNLNALEAAFLDEITRKKLREKLLQSY